MTYVKKKRMLIVDDDENILKSLTAYLTKKGYVVDVAMTGKEAIDKLERCSFDLAILDIKLPDMEGTTLLTKMQATQPKMTKIMLTGHPAFENVADSLNEGADAYLVKPVDMEKLLTVIEEKLKDQEDAETMDEKKIVRFIKTRGQRAEDDLEGL